MLAFRLNRYSGDWWLTRKKPVQVTCTDARDQNCAVWLVGCAWKFPVITHIRANDGQ